jgi:hypothetical protein
MAKSFLISAVREENLRREISATGDGGQIGSQEHGHWPTAAAGQALKKQKLENKWLENGKPE